MTGRQQAEDALRERKTKFRTLADTVAAAVFIAQGTKNRYVNATAEAITGYTQQELLRMNFWELVHPDFQELIRERGLARQRGEQVPARYEVKLLTKNGDVCWVDMTASLIEFAGQTAVLGTAFDITDRKHLQASLQSEYAFIETILDTAGAIVVVLDRRGQIIRFNRAAEEITGYTFADVRGRPIWDLFPTRSEMETVKAAFLAGEIEASHFPDEREINWLTGEGRPCLLTFTNTALLDSNGLVKYIVSVGNDITAARQAEEALRRSEARNRAILDAIPDLIFRLGIDGTFLDYDCPPGVGLYAPAGVFVGQKVSDVLPRKLAQKIMRCIDQARQTGQIQLLEYQLPANEPHDYEARIVAAGRSEALAIVQNITERKQAQQKIIKAERLAALGRLAATLAHEINNPLQAIQGHLELVLDFPLEPEERAGYLDVIAQEIGRLIDITRRVLNFAHPAQEPRRPVSVIELAQRTLALVSKRLQNAHIQVSTDWQDVPPVMAAPDQLTQVFLNLVINAIEAIPTGGQLQVGTHASNGQVEISFANDGPPIPSQDIPHIFEPFFTTKSGGSGLGLSTSHNLVRQHGGMLTVENLEDGQGVIFTVKLPQHLRADL